MVKFLIASHGYLADGFKSSVGVIMGQEIANRILTLNAFIDDNPESTDIKTLIQRELNAIKEEDQLVIFSDILHGSVNQMLIPYVNDEKIYIITGINLSIICEVMATYCYSDEHLNLEKLREVVIAARKELVFVNDLVKQTQAVNTNDPEKDFF